MSTFVANAPFSAFSIAEHLKAGYIIEALVSRHHRTTTPQGLRREPGIVFSQTTPGTGLQQAAAQREVAAWLETKL